MKKPKSYLGATTIINNFIVILSIFYLFSCSNIDSVSLPDDWPNEIAIEANDYNSFVTNFNERFNKLSLNQQELLNSYIREKNNSIASNPNGRTNDASTCNCQTGQTSCSAQSWWSSCCVCCSGGASAACGESGPITTCKCNEKDKSLAPAKAIENGNLVTIYPNRFKDLFTFADQNSIDLTSIKVLFSDIMKKNI